MSPDVKHIIFNKLIFKFYKSVMVGDTQNRMPKLELIVKLILEPVLLKII